MILPDVSVLLYAFRSDSERHAEYRSWLYSVVRSQHPYGMSAQVLASVMRVATHPRIFRQPSRMEEALAFANALLEQPNCQMVEPGPDHWRIFQRLCRSAQVSGNLVQHAWYAALAIESGCQWITTDRV
ncbi:MAG: PIN domain-containing protein [Bryobacteraceae bacterium]|nr:PIN domain-containing protein [Bryobacteraceae bacterium]